MSSRVTRRSTRLARTQPRVTTGSTTKGPTRNTTRKTGRKATNDLDNQSEQDSLGDLQPLDMSSSLLALSDGPDEDENGGKSRLQSVSRSPSPARRSAGRRTSLLSESGENDDRRTSLLSEVGENEGRRSRSPSPASSSVGRGRGRARSSSIGSIGSQDSARKKRRPRRNSNGSLGELHADLPLSPGHHYNTRRKSMFRSLATSLTTMQAIGKFLRFRTNSPTRSELGSLPSQEPTAPEEVEEEMEDIGFPSYMNSDDEDGDETVATNYTSGMRFASAFQYPATRLRELATDKRLHRLFLVDVMGKGLIGLLVFFLLWGTRHVVMTRLVATNQTSLSTTEIPKTDMTRNETIRYEVRSEFVDLDDDYIKAIVQDELNKIENSEAAVPPKNDNRFLQLEKLVADLEEKTMRWYQVYQIDTEEGFDPASHAMLPKVSAIVQEIQEMKTQAKPNTSSSEKNTNRQAIDVEQYESRINAMEVRLERLLFETQNRRETNTAQYRQQEYDDDDGASCLNFSEAQDIVSDQLEMYAADKIARPDHALGAFGSMIEERRGLTSPRYDPIDLWTKLQNPLFLMFPVSHPPSVVLDADVTVGNCWACGLPNCNLTIMLRHEVVVDAVSIDHISPRIAHDIRSAPRKLRVFGFQRLPSAIHDEDGYVHLGDFEYDTNKVHVQTFELDSSVQGIYRWIKFQFLSNHGHPDFTCIYRLRVHGNRIAT